MSDQKCCPIRRFTLNTTTFVPVVTPIDCAYFGILGTSDGSQYIRSSDPANAAAWVKESGYALLVPPGFQRNRWVAGDTITWLKASIGTPDAIVEFIPGT